MIVVITRGGKCAGISTVVGSIDTRVMTEVAKAALAQDLNELALDKSDTSPEKVQYKIDVSSDHGNHHSFIAAHDPNSPWGTPLKRILNRIGIVDRI